MNAKEYAIKRIYFIWKGIKILNYLKMLKNKNLDFEDIRKKDTKLIFKCIVLINFYLKKKI